MPDTSSILGLPMLMPSQAQKHVTHNEALRVLDALVQLSVEALDTSVPPTEALQGDRFIVGTGGTGAWSGHDGKLAVYEEGTWLFYMPTAGSVCFVRSTAQFATYDGTNWTLLDGIVSPSALGINTSPDAAINRLSLRAHGSLFDNEGGDHRMTVNKADALDTASMVFQSDYSGRAEIGLPGDDNFAIKVSADGASWITALQFDAATGTAGGQAVQQAPSDAMPGRLMLAQHGILRTDMLGPVSQSGGAATGAIIERGSNAQGDFVKWADGTMMCFRRVTVDINSLDPQVFSYPIPMVSNLAASATGADVAEMGSALRPGGAKRRKAIGELAVWSDTQSWHVRLHQSVEVDTVDVNLMATGFWV